MNNEQDEYKPTTVNLGSRHLEWIEGHGRGFNFSEWVREQIEKELKKQEKKK